MNSQIRLLLLLAISIVPLGSAACSSDSTQETYESGFALLLQKFERLEEMSQDYIDLHNTLWDRYRQAQEVGLPKAFEDQGWDGYVFYYTAWADEVAKAASDFRLQLGQDLNELRSLSLSNFEDVENLETIRTEMLDHYYVWEDSLQMIERGVPDWIRAWVDGDDNVNLKQFTGDMKPATEQIRETFRLLCGSLGRLQPSVDDESVYEDRISAECAM
jgi:hypothetical protein